MVVVQQLASDGELGVEALVGFVAMASRARQQGRVCFVAVVVAV